MKIDLRNYYCCSSHKIFLHDPSKTTIETNLPVFAGKSFVGQIKKTYMSFIEVILLSDIEHVLPVKSNFFYCDARGKGVPMLISCKIKNDNFFTIKNILLLDLHHHIFLTLKCHFRVDTIFVLQLLRLGKFHFQGF